MPIVAPTCLHCGTELEYHAARDEWWCWRDSTAFRLDEDGYLSELPKGAA